VKGDYGLISNPASKGGGEKYSYSTPTRQCLTGIIDAIYFKPTFKNVVTELKVMNPIQTEVIGTRALVGNMKADLNYVSYLINVEYLVRFHMEWNDNRPDLVYDRNIKKHEAIMEKSIKRGGRRDIFIGTRECVATAEYITKEEYMQAKSAYEGQVLSLGIMFQEFEYPTDSNEPLKSYFKETFMKDGIIKFDSREKCEIVNELSNYKFKLSEKLKSVDDEFNEYKQMEKR
jgi:CRISPR-associated protein Cas5d